MRGITIILNGESVHTGNDLDLVQEVKTIGKPEIQSHTVEVPGRNGLLNLTKGLTGKVTYFNRELEFQYFGTGKRDRLLEIDAFMSRYHGQTIRIIDDDYPDWYYEGEASVETEINGNYITISLTVDAQPFRRKLAPTVESYDYSYLETGKAAEFHIRIDGVAVIPTITVIAESAFNKRGTQKVTLSPGTYTIETFELTPGDNTFYVWYGIFTFEYQEEAI